MQVSKMCCLIVYCLFYKCRPVLFFYRQLSLWFSLSPSSPDLPRSASDKLTGGVGRAGDKKSPLVFRLEQASLPTLARARTLIRHAHAQGWLAVRRLLWRQDQGEKEGEAKREMEQGKDR